MPATQIPPEKLIEITGKPAMSQAELKKLEELKRLKKEAKREFSSFRVLLFREREAVLQKHLRFVKCLVTSE